MDYIGNKLPAIFQRGVWCLKKLGGRPMETDFEDGKEPVREREGFAFRTFYN
jgi:hypothetical protein